MYSSADKSVQLTVFAGNDMMTKFQPLVQTATTVPELGPDARCTRTTIGGSAGASCIFLHGGDTYILSSRVPPAASESLLGDVTALAEKMAAGK
jgi:hypothetical protein